MNNSGLYGAFVSDFHQKWHERDPRRDEVRSIEFGWSGFAGGSEGTRQGIARDEGVPYKLAAWLDPRGVEFMHTFMEPLLPRLWSLCNEYYKVACDHMLDVGMAHLYGLFGTGWNKITIGIDNPTQLHYDNKNVGITALLIIGLHGLKGGSHALIGVDLGVGVIVEECHEGTLVFGDYAHVLHGNLATIAGSRVVVNAYCSANVVSRIS